MLTSQLIHPEIIYYLSQCGHGSKILIADGNYPLSSKTGNANKIYLGFAHDIPTVTEVLSILHSICNFETAEVMTPDNMEHEPEIFRDFRKELNLDLIKLPRFDFYNECMHDDNLLLAISTGETRTFANILLTIGVA